MGSVICVQIIESSKSKGLDVNEESVVSRSVNLENGKWKKKKNIVKKSMKNFKGRKDRNRKNKIKQGRRKLNVRRNKKDKNGKKSRKSKNKGQGNGKRRT